MFKFSRSTRILFYVFLYTIVFKVGFYSGYKKNKITQEEISSRYFKVLGNPKTQEQQCKFDYIIYNDSTECK